MPIIAYDGTALVRSPTRPGVPPDHTRDEIEHHLARVHRDYAGLRYRDKILNAWLDELLQHLPHKR